jgi:hypothetical protein
VPRKDSEDENPNRPRAFTTSSYASTATPPKPDQNDLGLSLGGNFADMFSGFGKRKSAILEVEDLTVKSGNSVGAHTTRPKGMTNWSFRIRQRLLRFRLVHMQGPA